MSTTQDSNVVPADAAVPVGSGYTLEKLDALPDDGKKREIIDGDLFVSPSPQFGHQRASNDLSFILTMHCKNNHLGQIFVAPFDYICADDTVVQPDIMWLPNDHPQITDVEGRLRHTPGLVVEILSPGNTKMELERKFELYQREGVAHYWIADPKQRTIRAWSLIDGVYKEDPDSQPHHSSFCAKPFRTLMIDLEAVFP